MELSEFYVPNGRHFFAVVSKYDDYLADIERRPGYKAGDTLKLILPFLKAFGATDEGMRKFSRAHILFVPGAKEALCEISGRMETFIISTSYEPYIDALCDVVGFPKDRAYSTEINIDRYTLKNGERERLLQLAGEIGGMEMIEWPEGVTAFEDLSEGNRKMIERLDRIFWEEIKGMAIGKILSDVNPVGGKQKAEAVLRSLGRTGNTLKDVIYVGDSITDREAFDLVREGGGVTFSFNGNRYALRSAEFACLSPDAHVLSVLAEAFRKGGRKGVMEGMGRRDSLSAGGYPKICQITDANRAQLIQESEAFRKEVRGVAVGSLG
jgi:energy-converting hydrogenase A subunit R